jgi:hypothetical protein
LNVQERQPRFRISDVFECVRRGRGVWMHLGRVVERRVSSCTVRMCPNSAAAFKAFAQLN